MTTPARRWRGEAANLVVIGAGTLLATGLSGCGERATFHRNIYSAETDCALDYSPSICASQGTHGSGQFFGPVYRMARGRAASCSSSDPGPGRSTMLGIAGQAKRTGIMDVQRGGFGTSCASRGSSGTTSRRSFSSWGG